MSHPPRRFLAASLAVLVALAATTAYLRATKAQPRLPPENVVAPIPLPKVADEPPLPYPVEQDLRPKGGVAALDGEPAFVADDPREEFRRLADVLEGGEAERAGEPPDGRSRIYARRVGSLADEDQLPGEAGTTNLYEVETGRERRLTWGGGFSAPRITADGRLECVLETFAPDGPKHERLSLPLTAARAWADRPEWRRRTVRAWVAFAADVLASAEATTDDVEEDTVERIAAVYPKHYRTRFGVPPDSAAELDALRFSLRDVEIGAEERRRLDLVLGVAAGEYLRRRHGARWDFRYAAPGDASHLFALVVDPFAGDYAPFGSLRSLLSEADGRLLLLSPRRAGLAPPNELSAGAGADALLALAERHPGNLRLALHVGTLLNGHAESLRRLVATLDVERLKDARVYHLLGLSRMSHDPASAAEAFRLALRCDQHFGPAYVNLAEACAAGGDVRAARLCLERFLELMPSAPGADEARRRLAELGDATGDAP